MWTAIKCAYLGWLFHGSQIQPGVHTVEGELTRSLSNLGYSFRVRLASRTDRGVSSLGNVFVIPCIERRFRAINASLSGVICYSRSDVPEGFNPRHATTRWYRYIMPVTNIKNRDVFEEGLKLFEGVHNFSGFTREKYKNTLIKIESITISDSERSIIIDIRAERFLMHMVRFMISSAVRASESGSTREIEDSLQSGIRPHNLAPADPHGLILMDIEYEGVKFHPIPIGSRRLRTWVHSSLLRTLVESQIFTHLHEYIKNDR